jgi:predicted protein tyrosine phosphatase
MNKKEIAIEQLVVSEGWQEIVSVLEQMKQYHYSKAISTKGVQERISCLDKLLVLDEVLNLPNNIINQIKEDNNG